MNSHLTILTYKARREDLVFIKAILEGYDNMAIMTTIDPLEGVFEVRVPDLMVPDIEQLFHQIHSTTLIERIGKQ